MGLVEYGQWIAGFAKPMMIIGVLITVGCMFIPYIGWIIAPFGVILILTGAVFYFGGKGTEQLGSGGGIEHKHSFDYGNYTQKEKKKSKR